MSDDQSDAPGFLDPEEWDRLTEEEQRLYLLILQGEAEEWKLTPRQQTADDLSDQVDETLMGGAAGGGKSAWILHRTNKLSKRFDNHRSLILRSNFPMLRRTLIRSSWTLFRTGADDDPIWRAADKEWRYPNGSIIEFGFCETDDDVGQYLSAEYELICFDELTEFTYDQYMMIKSRVRTTQAKRDAGVRPHVIGCTNPGQRGHTWVKNRFVLPTDYGEHVHTEKLDRNPITGDEETKSVAFVKSTVTDNPYIDPGYVRELMDLPEIKRRMYLEGDWDVFAGMYFSEFSRACHVIPPFEIPPNWPRERGLDYGFTAPFCCLWGAWDEDGRLFIYREAYAPELTAAQQAELILSKGVSTHKGITKPEALPPVMADPSIFNTIGGKGQSIAQQYRDNGLACRKANNERVAGWTRLREYLRNDPNAKVPDWLAELRSPNAPEGAPGIFIFENCVNLLRTLPEMIHDDARPEDLMKKGQEDHAVDALRYLVVQRQREPSRDKPVTDMSMQARINRVVQATSRKVKGYHHPELGKIR